MALTNCGKCGMQISDKADTCIHCGALILHKKVLMPCPECSTMIEEGVNKCPKCGYPLSKFQSVNNEKEEKHTNKEDAATLEKVSSNTISIISVFVLVIVFACIFVSYRKQLFSTDSKPDSSLEYSNTPNRASSSFDINESSEQKLEDNANEDYKQEQNDDKNSNLTIQLVGIQNKLRETIDELAELQQTGNGGLRIQLLKQRIVQYYEQALEIAHQTDDENLISEYENRKERTIEALQMIK